LFIPVAVAAVNSRRRSTAGQHVVLQVLFMIYGAVFAPSGATAVARVSVVDSSAVTPHARGKLGSLCGPNRAEFVGLPEIGVCVMLLNTREFL
jgi:hypothetical protein